MNVKLFQQLAAAKLEVVAKLKTSQGGALLQFNMEMYIIKHC